MVERDHFLRGRCAVTDDLADVQVTGTTFCTAVNCIDGRTQLPVIHWLSKRFDVEQVDLITEVSPVRVLDLDPGSNESISIYKRVDVSIRAHDSRGLAIVAHHDCAGNPAPDEAQIDQLEASLDRLAKRYPHLETLALWVDEHFAIHEIARRSPLLGK
jgi:hypothetical protein